MVASPQHLLPSSPATPSRIRVFKFPKKSGMLWGRRGSSESFVPSSRPQPEVAKKWSESFSSLMTSNYGAALFRAFLLREFSHENLDFWMAVEDYRKSKPQKMVSKAQKIYNNFVAVQAPNEVNLDPQTRLTILNKIRSNQPDGETFDQAQKRIQYMMEQDPYARFLRSELFLELIHPELYTTVL